MRLRVIPGLSLVLEHLYRLLIGWQWLVMGQQPSVTCDQCVPHKHVPAHPPMSAQDKLWHPAPWDWQRGLVTVITARSPHSGIRWDTGAVSAAGHLSDLSWGSAQWPLGTHQLWSVGSQGRLWMRIDQRAAAGESYKLDTLAIMDGW